MNYNSLMNKPTINYRELIGDNTVTEVGGITEEQFNTLLNTDLSSYYTKAQIDDLFSRSYVYREKSGSIVTFDCPESTTSGITEVVSDIVAVQSGTGDPSPTNVRPISGFTEVNVVVSPTTDAEDGTTYTTALKDGQGNTLTCYGGTLDVVSGVLTVLGKLVDLPSLGWGKSINTANIYFYVLYTSGANGTYNDAATNVKSNIYTPKSRISLTNVQGTVGVSAEANALYIADGRFDNYTVAQFKEAVSDVQLLLPLVTPITIQLTPTAVKSLLGTNNIWADSGDITVKALDKIIQG